MINVIVFITWNFIILHIIYVVYNIHLFKYSLTNLFISQNLYSEKSAPKQFLYILYDRYNVYEF